MFLEVFYFDFNKRTMHIRLLQMCLMQQDTSYSIDECWPGQMARIAVKKGKNHL